MGAYRSPPPSPLFLRFDLQAILGSGGMGSVFRAYDRHLRRLVALKIPHEGALEWFFREVAITLRSHHRNVVRAFDASTDHTSPWLALELLLGGSLTDLLQKGPLPDLECARIALAAARGLGHLHSLGILHRDVGPNNLMRSTTGRWKLCDMGLARRPDHCESLTSPDAILGTPCYRAPEQTGGRNHEIGEWSDCYALGATMYAMLTGHPPFLGPSRKELDRQIREANPIPPRSLCPGVSSDLEAIVLKLLEKNPKKRFRTATDLVGALKRFLAT